MRMLLPGSLLWLALFGAVAYSASNREPSAINGCIYSSASFAMANGQHASFSCDINGNLMTSGG